MPEKVPRLFDDAYSYASHVRRTVDAIEKSRDEMALLQQQDHYCQSVLGLFELRRPTASERRVTEKFIIINKLLYRINDRVGERDKVSLVLPRPKRKQFMLDAHDKSGHAGQRACIANIRRKHWWPGMQDDITEHIQNCVTCLRRKPDRRPRPIAIAPTNMISNIPPIAFHTIAADIIVMPLAYDGHRYILTSIDLLTKWVTMVPLKSVDAETVITALIERTFKIFQPPSRVITDNGTHFVGKFQDKLNEMAIKQTFISPYRPNCNGMCERAQGSIKTRLWFFARDNTTRWPDYLPDAVASYNHSVHKTTGFSPYYLLCGGTAASVYDVEPDMQTATDTDHHQRITRLTLARESARERILRDMSRSAADANQRKQFKSFTPGDLVMLLKKTRQKGKWQAVPFSGPYRVSDSHRSNTYYITSSLWPDSEKVLAHADRLKLVNSRRTNPRRTHDASTLEAWSISSPFTQDD